METQRLNSGVLLRVDYPDEDLRRRIESFLRSRHFSSFRNLQVQVRGGVATLQGEVGSFYEKQVALDRCRRVAGVMSLNDQLQVSSERAGETLARDAASFRDPVRPLASRGTGKALNSDSTQLNAAVRVTTQPSRFVEAAKRGAALQVAEASAIEILAGTAEPGGSGRRLEFPDKAGVGSF